MTIKDRNNRWQALLMDYESACERIAQAFAQHYFEDYSELDFTDWVGGESDGVCMINDYFISIKDMVTCLERRIPRKTFFDWYDKSLEAAMKEDEFVSLEVYYLWHHRK